MNETNVMVANANNGILRVGGFNYDELEPEVAARLHGYEADARRYMGDIQHSLLQLAYTMQDAKKELARVKGRPGQWTVWANSVPGMSDTTANRLVQYAEQYPREEYRDRSLELPAGLTSIAAIGAYLSAPEPVKDEVKSGTVTATQEKISEATLLYQKAQARVKELEAAFAKQQEEITGLKAVREDAEKVLRYAETEMENAKLKQATIEREMKDRIAAATESERKAIQKQYDAELFNAQREFKVWQKKAEELQKQTDEARKKAERDLRDAQRVAAGLAEQLKRSADEGARWARWEITAVRTSKQLDQITKEMPTDEDVVIFLDGHWKLLDELLADVETLRARLVRLQQKHHAGATVVDAG